MGELVEAVLESAMETVVSEAQTDAKAQSKREQQAEAQAALKLQQEGQLQEEQQLLQQIQGHIGACPSPEEDSDDEYGPAFDDGKLPRVFSEGQSAMAQQHTAQRLT